MVANPQPALGQRWLSNAEIELGLGTVVTMDERMLTLMFPASGESRQYALKQAPITRITFSEGEVAEHHEGWSFKVESITANAQVLTYHGTRVDDGSSVEVKETFLSHDYSLSEPLERLLGSQYDNGKWFNIRKETIANRQAHYSSDVLGFVGARAQLIPHQLHIAKTVGQRMAPRVLLADEVGLGKTIEAALIVHQQLLTERAQRVLIVVPESLVNQWLVEMLRKFNLRFAIFDAERCESLAEEPVNPFETEQLVLCSLDFLTHNSRYFEQALQAGWDLMVVDEAHHLKWSAGNPSQEYEVIEHLAGVTPGVLLLTATPDQLGHESHFARLRLLDPDRFHDYESFLKQEQRYSGLAKSVAPLINNDTLDDNDIAALTELVPDLQVRFGNIVDDGKQQRALVSELIDRHGTGRILFRNSRNTISGFPKRLLSSYELELPAAYADLPTEKQAKASLTPEIYYAGNEFWVDVDPRVNWLLQLLQDLKGKKLLIICANAITAIDLADVVRTKSGIRATVFHEGMSIVERDKAANYFAQTENGAQVLFASEIGSEGRNFQFAHHLVLFDLPINPDLLEQRIGRLDRIGQKNDVHIHVPVFTGTAQSVLLDWYHQGLDAFSKTCPVGAIVYDEVQEVLQDCLQQPGDSELRQTLMVQSQSLRLELSRKMEQGRDRLLELNSSGQGNIEPFIELLQEEDDSPTLERFMTRLLDTIGVLQEEKDDNCYLLTPTESMVSHLPGLDDEGMTITYERQTAATLEHIQFMTWDHPLVHNAMDMLLADVHGKSSISFVADKQKPAGFFWVDCVYVLSATGKRTLQLSHYFPPHPISVCIDGTGKLAQHGYFEFDKVPPQMGSQLVKALQNHIENSVTKCDQYSENLAQSTRDEITLNIRSKLGAELERLTQLKAVNPSIRDDEIELLQTQLAEITEAIKQSKLRLEAIHLIVNNP